MKKFFISLIGIASIAAITYLFLISPVEDEMEQKRAKHEKFLAESPFNATKNLTRSERKKLGLPPNAYNERMWELTMNPDLGYPTPFLVKPVLQDRSLEKNAPGTASAPWIERGPLNVGGRTRVVFFDPNDVGANNGDGVDYNRVFAGGVGGGLWVNNNINSLISRWNIIPGLASNLSVSAYAIDPNDSNTFYIGTGEQYTDGAAIGDGLYRTTDGGTTWERVNIPVQNDEYTGGQGELFQTGIFHINDIIARDVNGQTELYVGVGASRYFSPNFTTSNPINYLGAQSAGIYRSTDNGTTWSRNDNFNLKFFTAQGPLPIIPNDFEIGADGTLYMSSIHSPGFNTGGGRVYSSTNGTTWTIRRTFPNTSRTEIATSRTNPNKIYILTSTNNQADLHVTTDGFATVETLTEPSDADQGIPNSDFTRGQSFYDLVIETAPNNDQRIYVGGINIHSSSDGGQTWQQLSKWSNNPNMDNLAIPFVHADIHAITFDPSNPTRAVIGSDGGVSYTANINSAASDNTAIQDRIIGYNVTQFYYGDIDQLDFEDGDDFLGGTQDNGSPVFKNSNPNGNLSNSIDFTGGDGSYSAIDDEGEYAILGYTSRTHIYFQYPITNQSSSYFISNENDGDFINVAELDSQFDLFYANSRTDTNNVNSITACQLGTNSANCQEITGEAIAQGRPTAMKASPFATVSPTLFVGSQDSRVFRIDNAGSATGNNIIDISSNDFLGSVSDIEFGASELELFVTFHNYGINNVWYSPDGGITWQQKDGDLPDVPVKAILQNPLVPTEVIIGTEIGIFSTSDFDSASPTWVLSNNGMTNVKVVDLDLRTADNTILATTHGRGMFTGKFTAGTASNADVARLNDQVKVFPTQTSNQIKISSNQNWNDARIEIYNLNGQKVLSQQVTIGNSPQRIQVSGLSSGVYLMKIKADGLEQTTKFIKE